MIAGFAKVAVAGPERACTTYHKRFELAEQFPQCWRSMMPWGVYDIDLLLL
jgi:hypothetical protein